MIGIYSYFGYLSSIGEDVTERHENAAKEKDSEIDDVWKEGIFDDTKHICYRMFEGWYRTDSWSWKWNWDFDFNFVRWTKDIMPSIFVNMASSVRWWQRWRVQKSRPVDKDGEQCKSAFGKFFSI